MTLTIMDYPGCLDQRLVLLTFKHLQVHDYNLVWMFDVYAEAKLLQHAPFSFYHLVFGVYVVLIKYQWAGTH